LHNFEKMNKVQDYECLDFKTLILVKIITFCKMADKESDDDICDDYEIFINAKKSGGNAKPSKQNVNFFLPIT
jgi:hypothetical protein